MIYFATNWGAKEPQNLPNHRVVKEIIIMQCSTLPVDSFETSRRLMVSLNTSHWKAEKSTNRPISREWKRKNSYKVVYPSAYFILLFRYLYSKIVLYIKYCLVLFLKIGKVYSYFPKHTTNKNLFNQS